MELSTLLERLDGVRILPSGISARCPAHDDHVASLSISEGEAGILLYCHAGCPLDRILSALHITHADINAAPHIIAEYPYQGADQELRYTVQRWSPKDFRVAPGLPVEAQRVPYNLPWVLYGMSQGQTIYVVEGEKDVETLRGYGLVGTCNVGGAGVGKWLDHYSRYMTGADVVVIADNDEPGIVHARAVYQSVRQYARSAYVARPLYGKDVTELLRAGYPISHTESVPEDAPLHLLIASGVRQRKVGWAWQGVVPAGAVTIIEGDPGDGKSTITTDLVARWTTKMPMPDGSEHEGPFHCVMVSAEDDPAVTIVPRLAAAGANLDRVALVTGGSRDDGPFNFAYDIPALEDTIRQYDAKILVLDPLMAFMPEKVSGLVDSEVRRTLYPIKRMAERLGVAVIVVRHLVKSGTKAMYGGSGSIGIIGAARAAYLVKPDPRRKGSKVLACVKLNVGIKPKAIGYLLESVEDTGVARITWTGEVEWDADGLYEDIDPEKVSAQEAAEEWLAAVLESTAMTWKEITVKGRGEGHSEHTLRRARAALQDRVIVQVTNPPDPITNIFLRGTYWHLKDQNPFGDGQLPDSSLAHPTGSLSDGQTTNPVTDSSLAQDAPSDGQDRIPPFLRKVSDVELPDADDREIELAQRADKSCDVCGEAETIMYGRPWFTWRCQFHDPRTTP